MQVNHVLVESRLHKGEVFFKLRLITPLVRSPYYSPEGVHCIWVYMRPEVLEWHIFDNFLRCPFFCPRPRRVELPILPTEQVIQSWYDLELSKPFQNVSRYLCSHIFHLNFFKLNKNVIFSNWMATKMYGMILTWTIMDYLVDLFRSDPLKTKLKTIIFQ